MSIRKLSSAEIEALLTDLSNRFCSNGCDCIFCRTFEEGVQSGKHDAEIHFRRALEKFAREIGKS